MKLAVVGSGPTALLAAHHFYQLGAHVVLFSTSNLVEKFQSQKDLFDIANFLHTQSVVKEAKVLRIHKRFLSNSEEIEGRSRFLDLFRVVFSKNPKESILKQVEENPEVFKKLGNEVLESLHHPIESYEDFDLVIEATGGKSRPSFMGPGGVPAINELNIFKDSPIFYGRVDSKEISPFKKIAVVGSGVGFTNFLNILKLKLIEDKTAVGIIISDEDLINLKNPILNELIHEIENEFQSLLKEHQEKVFNWRELDDHVKAKIPFPPEPQKRLTLFSGYEVSNVDKLLDQKEMFLTIESPEFRNHTLVRNDLKTLACDSAFVFKSKYHKSELSHDLRSNEIGYYNIKPLKSEEIIKEILECEKIVMNLFSREVQ